MLAARPRRLFVAPTASSSFFMCGGISLHSEHQFSDFVRVAEWMLCAMRALCASLCSSVHSRFFAKGLCPSRNRYRGQPDTVHSFTSKLLPQQQSRHLRRIAFKAVIRFSYRYVPPDFVTVLHWFCHIVMTLKVRYFIRFLMRFWFLIPRTSPISCDILHSSENGFCRTPPAAAHNHACPCIAN